MFIGKTIPLLENHRKMVVEWDYLGNLVGGDWNMTFIFPYIGDNHPN